MARVTAVLLFLLISWASSWTIRKKLDFDGSSNSIEEKTVVKALSVIFPGTKWCGSGNAASGYDDLGSEAETDMCCREHDFCPDIIQSGQSLHGLTNDALYTRLHCDCDQKFLECLKKPGKNHELSTMVGTIYFDVLNTKCYRYEHPIVKCAKYTSFPQRCIEYTYDTTAEKAWQWFDVPLY